jgi:hypothetical protein
MTNRTVFLSKLIGLYCIFVSLVMLANKQAGLLMVTDLARNPSALFTLGAFVLLAGLAMILTHNIWSGGALPVIVTIVGWLTAIKGLLFLCPSQGTALGMVLATVRYEQFYYAYYAIALIVGIYLTYGGFRRQT